MKLINWHWLEEMLLRACEMEARAFGPQHPAAQFHAFCLEFDPDAGTLACSYGDRDSVERAAAETPGSQYRVLELRPEHWRYRQVTPVDPDGAWENTEQILAKYRENVVAALAGESQGDVTPAETAEFYRLRFEYLADNVARGLAERDVFRALTREEEFLIYAAAPAETLEELEDRIEKAYPQYRRATQEWLRYPRLDEFRRRICSGSNCGKRGRGMGLLRCTACGRWYCGNCRGGHAHLELEQRQPFFAPWPTWAEEESEPGGSGPNGGEPGEEAA